MQTAKVMGAPGSPVARGSGASPAVHAELFDAIFRSPLVGVVEFDARARFRVVNDRFCEITGYSRRALLVGMNSYDITHPDDIDGARRSFARLDEEDSITIEKRYVRPDGATVWVSKSISAVRGPGGELETAVAIVTDVTDRHRAEEAIIQSMAAKDQFLGLVSHELRTPIATILGNALLLLRCGDTLDRAEKDQALTDVADEAAKLQRIIENLLLLTRLEAGQQLETEPLRLPMLVAQSVASFQRRNTTRPITVTGEDGLPIALGQPTVLALVMDNLLGNADKYSAPGAPIEVRMRRRGRRVEVRVRDYGIGLDAKEVEEIFTPFYRSPRARSQAKGIGLGLAVCKRVIEAQGGSIRALPREDGCDFVFTLHVAANGAD